MKILMVSFVAPWPLDSGARIRAGHMLRALEAVGDVDLYLVLDEDRVDAVAPPEDLGVRRLRVRTRPAPSVVRQRMSWLRPGGPPRRVAGWANDLHDDLRQWADPSYDLVWVVRAAVLSAVGGLPRGPVIIDLDDLNDVKAHERAELAESRFQRWGIGVDARRWTARQHRLASTVDRVAVCSELDLARAGVSNGVVIANGYESDDRLPPELTPLHDPPTLLLQGALLRPSLVDAARTLAMQILPSVRQRFPSARALLVGQSNDAVRRLTSSPGVHVEGFVPDMRPWLEAADLVAVPMRWGGGTRIKILEAFANGIPVVASTVGAEGLDVEDGRHILIADDPASFADACMRVFTDEVLRDRLAREGRALYEDRYRWEPVRTRIGELAREVAAGTRVGSGG